MKIKEYGNKNGDAVMLLHGGGLGDWNYREAAEILSDRYRVILPSLDGHAGSDRGYTTIEDNADEITAYIDENLGGSLLLLGGVSLGAQTVLAMLMRRRGICRHAIIESALVCPMKLTNALVEPMLAISYGLIKKRWFARLQATQLRIKDELFEEYYRDTQAITRSDMTAFLKANTSFTINESLRDTDSDVHIFVGQKENRDMQRSAKLLNQTIPKSTLTVLPGMYHGEFSLGHADEFAAAVNGITNEHGRSTI